MPRPALSTLLLLALLGAAAGAQDDERLQLQERIAQNRREQAEIEAQQSQWLARLEILKQEQAALDRRIQRLERADGPAAPESVSALGQRAAGLGAGDGWEAMDRHWEARPLSDTALRELRRSGESLRRTVADRRAELTEILGYVDELGQDTGDLRRFASEAALDGATSWRDELLRIEVARAIGIHRILRFLAGSGGDDGLSAALDRERQRTSSRHRRKLQSVLLRLIKERPQVE